ncbi:MAG TPA: STAS domain-containing protein [Acidimicrobiales bacterium]|nr:STAS domain-containing protein [Acidimicrobiales bacterium]
MLEVPFDVTTAEREGLAIVAVAGELDCAAAPRLSAALAAWAEPGRVVLVDLWDVEFADCAGLSPLVAAAEHQRHIGGELIIDAGSGPAAKLIDWAQLDRVVTIVPNSPTRVNQWIPALSRV